MRELQERMEQEPETTHREPAQRQSGAASNSELRAAESARSPQEAGRQTASEHHAAESASRSPQEAGRQTAKARFRNERRNRPLRRERTIRASEHQGQTIKQTARSAGKQTIKTKETVRGAGKAVKETGKGIKTAAKTAEKASRLLRRPHRRRKEPPWKLPRLLRRL